MKKVKQQMWPETVTDKNNLVWLNFSASFMIEQVDLNELTLLLKNIVQTTLTITNIYN